MATDLLDWTAFAVLGSATLHLWSSQLLRNRISADSTVYRRLFRRTDLSLIPVARGIPALKLRYLMPWVEAPDLSAFDRRCTLYLFLCRATAIFGASVFLGAVFVGLVLPQR